MFTVKKIIALGFLLIPFIAAAQLPVKMSLAMQVWLFVRDFLNQLTIIVIGLPVVYFSWSTFKFLGAIRTGGNDAELKKRKSAVIKGIISIVAVILVWNLIIWIFFPVWVGPADTSRNSIQEPL